MKSCSKCKEIKPLDQFYIDKRQSKPRSWCKSCQNNANKEWRVLNYEKSRQQNNEHQLRFKLKNRYNLSQEDYEQALKQADGKCQICLKESELNIDHDHLTKQFRGLLCSKCNMGLGLFFDDIDILQNAIAYLISSKNRLSNRLFET